MNNIIWYNISKKADTDIIDLLQQNIVDTFNERIEIKHNFLDIVGQASRKHTRLETSNYKTPFKFLKERDKYSSWPEYFLSMASASTFA